MSVCEWCVRGGECMSRLQQMPRIERQLHYISSCLGTSDKILNYYTGDDGKLLAVVKHKNNSIAMPLRSTSPLNLPHITMRACFLAAIENLLERKKIRLGSIGMSTWLGLRATATTAPKNMCNENSLGVCRMGVQKIKKCRINLFTFGFQSFHGEKWVRRWGWIWKKEWREENRLNAKFYCNEFHLDGMAFECMENMYFSYKTIFISFIWSVMGHEHT